MNQKIKLLFVIESLTLAGSEKSLIALLSKLDYSKYDVDLQLFSYGDPLQEFLLQNVNLLPPLSFTEFTNLSWFQSLLKCNVRFLFARMKYSVKIRKGIYTNSQKAQFFWESSRNAFQQTDIVYDIAIAYAQSIPTYYVADKINASKKIAWVNVTVPYEGNNKSFQSRYYEGYDQIVPVSKDTEKHLSAEFPFLKIKLYTIEDVIDYKSIVRLSNLVTPEFDKNKFNILTVARLTKSQKGYDITLETCRILKEKNINFHWYVVGEGPYKNEMITFINENNLNDYFTFLGTTKNPYPYFRTADLYVQTSRHEGYGLSIAEARLLNTPVVTTRFDTVFMQMVHEKNGLVTDLNAEAVAEAIVRLMTDKNLYDSIVRNLKQEMKENVESIKLFNAMIEKLLLEKADGKL